MRYVGSKLRYRKVLSALMMQNHDYSRAYVEPFCGGGNLLSYVDAPIKVANDINGYAVALLRAVADGWVPPSVVTEDDYRGIRTYPRMVVSSLAGTLGVLIMRARLGTMQRNRCGRLLSNVGA